MRKKNRRQFTLSTEAEAILDEQDNQSRYVSDAVVAYKPIQADHADLYRAVQELNRRLTDLNEDKI